jgi:hypothetical protein
MDAERAQVYPFIGRPRETPLVIERTEGADTITAFVAVPRDSGT